MLQGGETSWACRFRRSPGGRRPYRPTASATILSAISTSCSSVATPCRVPLRLISRSALVVVFLNASKLASSVGAHPFRVFLA